MNWFGVKDGDPRAVALYRRHYSCRNPKVDYVRWGFSGKGESMVLLTLDCRALWCWRRVETEGIYCSVFRNEGDILSSELVKEADLLAWERWGDDTRHYTHVNPREVKGDGKCFKAAGWSKRRERTQKHRLVILEIFREPPPMKGELVMTVDSCGGEIFGHQSCYVAQICKGQVPSTTTD